MSVQSRGAEYRAAAPIPVSPGGNAGGDILFHDLEPEEEDFETAVLDGLGRPRKALPCKFFYDRRGSALFEQICTLDEYYPTRTETALLERHKAEMAAVIGADGHLIEFGSGAIRKVRILLGALQRPVAYTAVDISRDHMLQSAAALAGDFPGLDVIAVCADYTRPFDVPDPPAAPGARRIGFFPGSTIGNFDPDGAVRFLAGAAGILRGGGMLIGVDLKKDEAILNAAYNDGKGVTAAFNLNLLVRINDELGGDFDLAGFAHKAFYNAAEGRIEMHLISLRDQTATVGEAEFRFAEGEMIHTENSYKYSVDDFRDVARRAGFSPHAVWTDPDDLFSIHYLRAP